MIVFQGFRKLRRLLYFLAGVLVFVSAGAFIWNGYQDRQLTLNSAKEQVAVLADALQEHAERSFSEVSVNLDEILSGIDGTRLSHENEPKLHKVLKNIQKRSPQVGEFFVVGESGALVAHSGQYVKKGIQLSGREYYKYHIANLSLKPHVGIRFVSSMMGEWRISVTRRVNGRGGEFRGVIGVSVNPEYFMGFYKSLRVSRGGVIALFRTDGNMLVIYPHNDFTTDYNFSPAFVFPQDGKPHESGAFRDLKFALDHEDRIVGYSRLREFEVVALVALSSQEVLRPWKKRAILDILFTLIVLGVVALLVVVLSRRLAELELVNKKLLNQSSILAENEILLKRKNEDLEILYSLYQGVVRTLKVDAVLKETFRLLNKSFSTDILGVYLSPVGVSASEYLNLHMSFGMSEEIKTACMQLKRREGLAGRVVEMSEPCGLEITHYPDPELRSTFLKEGLRSLALIPLELGDKDSGLILLGFKQGRTFSPDSLQLFSAIGQQLGIAVQNARLYELAQDSKRFADEANRAKSDFLANMSHEIRTPMNAIVGISRLLEEGEIPERQRNYLKKMRSAADTLLGLINDVLDLSKIEANRLVIEPERTDLNGVLENLFNVISFQAEDKGIKLVITALEGVPRWIEADALRIQQVLLNLLSNAVKFTEQGMVGLFISSEDLSGVQPKQVRLTFKVTDTGIGMSQEQTKKIFEAYVQADGSISRRFGGSGLGLSISKKLVDLMSGQIQVESELGRGSSFTVSLVAKKLEDGSVTAPGAHAITQRGVASSEEAKTVAGLSVLLVEDNEINREVVREVLERAGLIVRVARDGQEAVDLFRENPKAIELILMDIQMPGMDGHMATREIRSMSGGARIPIIGLSAHALLEERKKAEASGMDDFLTKPIEPKQLLLSLARFARSNLAPGEAHALDLTLALEQMDGDRALFERMVELFIKNHAGAGSEIHGFIDKKDVKSAGRLAHTLKGVAGNIAARGLFEAANQLDRLIKDKGDQADSNELKTSAEKIEAEMKRVLLFAQKILSKS